MATRVVYDNFSTYALGDIPTTGIWSQDDFRNLVQIIASPHDAGPGPVFGSQMACSLAQPYPVTASDPACFQNAVISSFPMTNECFFRMYARYDLGHSSFIGSVESTRKILRIYHNGAGVGSTTYNDHFQNLYLGSSSSTGGVIDGGGQYAGQGDPGGTYWGGAIGDNTNRLGEWHKFEYYFSNVTNKCRIWHNGIMVRDDTIPNCPAPWYPFNLCSNWASAASDKNGPPPIPIDVGMFGTSNYVYYDKIEIYSDSTSGSAASGLMSDATINSNALPAPTITKFRFR